MVKRHATCGTAQSLAGPVADRRSSRRGSIKCRSYAALPTDGGNRTFLRRFGADLIPEILIAVCVTKGS